MTINETAQGGPDSRQCHEKALFFHLFSEGVYVIAPIVLGTLVAVFCTLISVTIPADEKKPDPDAPETDTSAIPLEAITPPQDTNPSTTTDLEEAPPPYQPPAAPAVEPTPPLILPGQVKCRDSNYRTSAEAFVRGTFILSLLLTDLILFAFSIQAILYCFDGEPMGKTGTVLWWCFYGFVCNVALWGIACWFVLLRNLWGPRAMKRFDFDPDKASLWILWVGLSPVSLVGFGLYHLVRYVGGGLMRRAVGVVEGWQSRLCGDRLDENEGEGSVSGDVELEDGRFGLEEGEAGDGEGEGGSKAQERHGLITGIEK